MVRQSLTLMCRCISFVAWLCIALAVVPLSAAAQDIAEPPGYRMDAYRAPVPATLKGAVVIDTAQAETLWRTKAAAFFDVLPFTAKPANLPAGTVWQEKARSDIPGSVWLANVGYGEINAESQAHFRAGLAHGGVTSPDTPMVFYCMRDCWMSWNAARRAISWGYTAVHWYPLGTDGWAEAGLPLETKQPFAP